MWRRRLLSIEFEIFRRRLLGQTERFLEDGLTHPEQYAHIPTKLASDRRDWPPGLGERFWDMVLTPTGER